MKADKDDVPDYLKPRKKQGPWRTLAILGVGSAIFWGLVTVFAKPIVIDVAQLKQAPQQPPAEALQGNDQDWIRSSQAQQTIHANRELEDIDGTTVCANHKRGSIDYRECRKAANQHYHEECRTWRAKYNNDRQDRSDKLRERYCVAASSFSPMGGEVIYSRT